LNTDKINGFSIHKYFIGQIYDERLSQKSTATWNWNWSYSTNSNSSIFLTPHTTNL